MDERSIYLVGVGGSLPPYEYTNAELAPYFNVDGRKAELYAQATGIFSRRSSVDLADNRRQKVRNETLAAEAAKVALSAANVAPNEIDHIITASSMFDYLLPSLSVRIQKLLGIYESTTYDLYGGCAQFIGAVHSAATFIKVGLAKKVLVTASETITSFARQFRYPVDAFIFGDAGGAWVLSTEVTGNETGPVFELKETESSSLAEFEGVPTETLIQPIGGYKEEFDLFHVDTKADDRMLALREDDRGVEYRWIHDTKWAKQLATFGMSEGFKRVRKDSTESSGLVIPHQGTKPVLQAVAEILPDGWPLIDNLAARGNLSTACIPVAMYEHMDRAAAAPEVVCSAVGVGFTYSAARLTPVT